MKNTFLLLSLFCLGSVARADLSYTQITSSPFGAMMGSGAGGIASKVYAKGDSNRTEAQLFGRKMITITRGAKNVIQVDPATKTYTVSNTGPAAIAKGFLPQGSMPGGQAKVPSMNMTVSTRKLGVQTVRGVKAPHYRVNMTMQIQTPRGPQNMRMDMEAWNSGVALPTSAKVRADVMQSLPANLKTMFGTNTKIKGDLKGMNAALGTVPLRLKMSMNGQTISTTETLNISQKTLPASLFAPPAGYRKVSNAQFNQRQQAAMRQSMAAMMKKMPGR